MSDSEIRKDLEEVKKRLGEIEKSLENIASERQQIKDECVKKVKEDIERDKLWNEISV